jgi:hypothetical protein
MTCTCCQPLSEGHRSAYTTLLFGSSFPLLVEPMVFTFAARLSVAYTGGLWQLYALSNGGFYMAPHGHVEFPVVSPMGLEGELSACAFGMTACLHAFDHLARVSSGRLAQACAEQYSLLRSHALDSAEAGSILESIS